MAGNVRLVPPSAVCETAARGAVRGIDGRGSSEGGKAWLVSARSER